MEEEKIDSAEVKMRIEKLPPLRCLLANDEMIQLTVMKHLFTRFGFEVVTAINGHLA